MPYIEKKWVQQTNEIYKKKGKITSKSVLGTYIRTMGMVQYKDLHFSDSDRLNFENQKAEQEAAAAREQQGKTEENLRARLERGEISQAEYNTLSVTTANAAQQAYNPGFVVGIAPPDNSALLEQLTEEDYQYLNLK